MVKSFRSSLIVAAVVPLILLVFMPRSLEAQGRRVELTPQDKILLRVIHGTGMGRAENARLKPERLTFALETLARSGALPQYPTYLLALRGLPQYKHDGTDEAREMIARMVNTDRNLGEATAGLQCQEEGRPCRATTVSAFESNEALEVATGIDRVVSYPDMIEQGFAQYGSGAAINGFTDALMNPDRYLNGKSADQLIISWKTDPERNRAAVMAAKDECFCPDQCKKENILDEFGKPISFNFRGLNECAVAGARWGIYFMADNPHVRYNGSQFMGR